MNKADGLMFVSPMDVILSDDTILQPDLLYIAKDRRGIVGERVMGAPDLVIEILSPGSDKRDRTEKLDLYTKYGVAEYWIVSPVGSPSTANAARTESCSSAKPSARTPTL